MSPGRERTTNVVTFTFSQKGFCMQSVTTIHLNRKPRALVLSRDERGLTTVEYVIVLVLLALGSIGVWRAFSSSLGGKIHESGNRIRDMDGTTSNGNGTPVSNGAPTSNGNANNASHGVSNASQGHSESPSVTPTESAQSQKGSVVKKTE